jgi:hypothetical protein
MRQATIEKMDTGTKVLGSPTMGRYHVLEYVDDEQVGGQFFETMKKANEHVSQYIRESDDE